MSRMQRGRVILGSVGVCYHRVAEDADSFDLDLDYIADLFISSTPGQPLGMMSPGYSVITSDTQLTKLGNAPEHVGAIAVDLGLPVHAAPNA